MHTLSGIIAAHPSPWSAADLKRISLLQRARESKRLAAETLGHNRAFTALGYSRNGEARRRADHFNVARQYIAAARQVAA